MSKNKSRKAVKSLLWPKVSSLFDLFPLNPFSEGDKITLQEY